MKKVAVIMGSDSDWPVVQGACTQLDALNIPYEAHIFSAHRTPAQAAEFAVSARANGFGVLINFIAAALASRTFDRIPFTQPCPQKDPDSSDTFEGL